MKRIKQTIVLSALIFLSCSSAKQMVSYDITIELIRCGSYKVKYNEQIIGYVVKPFFVEGIDRIKEITDFEHDLNTKYKNKFRDALRIYSFTTDRAGDIILHTIFLTEKDTNRIPNWNCELQDVDTYWQKKKTIFTSKGPESTTYNCSKKRFKVSGDPD